MTGDARVSSGVENLLSGGPVKAPKQTPVPGIKLIALLVGVVIVLVVLLLRR